MADDAIYSLWNEKEKFHFGTQNIARGRTISNLWPNIHSFDPNLR